MQLSVEDVSATEANAPPAEAGGIGFADHSHNAGFARGISRHVLPLDSLYGEKSSGRAACNFTCDSGIRRISFVGNDKRPDVPR
jgi:hypothetical protein